MASFPPLVELPEHAFAAHVSGDVPHHMLVLRRRPNVLRGDVPLVFVHGCCCNGGLAWETTPDGRAGWATLALRAGYETFVVDLPGHGRAPQPPDFATMGLDKAVAALRELLAELRSCVLIGHSMGGAVITRTLSVLSAQERGSVRAVVLVDPARVAGMGQVELRGGPVFVDLAGTVLPASHASELTEAAPMFPAELVDRQRGWHGPESGRSMAEMVTDDYGPPPDPAAYRGVPTLLLAAEWARGVGAGTIHSYRDVFGLEVTEVGSDWGLHGHGHAMHVESENQVIAQSVFDWLSELGLVRGASEPRS